MKRWTLVAGLIWLGSGLGAAQAATQFSCTINAVDANEQPISVSRTTCSAMVVYVNLETGEQQELLRSCRIRRNRTSCRAHYSDVDVLVGFPLVSGVGGYSKAAHMSRFAQLGCVQRPGDLATDADDFGNQQVNIVQNINCSS